MSGSSLLRGPINCLTARRLDLANAKSVTEKEWKYLEMDYRKFVLFAPRENEVHSSILFHLGKGRSLARKGVASSCSDMQFYIFGCSHLDPNLVKQVSTRMLFRHKSKDVLLSKIRSN